jgi:hypothetical protein
MRSTETHNTGMTALLLRSALLWATIVSMLFFSVPTFGDYSGGFSCGYSGGYSGGYANDYSHDYADLPPVARYAVQTSLWTTHFNNKPYHNNNQRLIGVERFGSNLVTDVIQEHISLFDSATPLAGATLFKNSFHQSTGYAYIGFRQPLIGNYRNNIYVKLTSGVMHGYRGEFRDKIPFNRFGTSVVAIPSAGVQLNNFTAETVLFGAAGVMVNVGLRF